MADILSKAFEARTGEGLPPYARDVLMQRFGEISSAVQRADRVLMPTAGGRDPAADKVVQAEQPQLSDNAPSARVAAALARVNAANPRSSDTLRSQF